MRNNVHCVSTVSLRCVSVCCMYTCRNYKDRSCCVMEFDWSKFGSTEKVCQSLFSCEIVNGHTQTKQIATVIY